MTSSTFWAGAVSATGAVAGASAAGGGASAVFEHAASKTAAKIGLPYLTGATVTATILGEAVGPKIITLKYKRRKGSRKKIGHRQGYLRVKIDAIAA